MVNGSKDTKIEETLRVNKIRYRCHNQEGKYAGRSEQGGFLRDQVRANR